MNCLLRAEVGDNLDVLPFLDVEPDIDDQLRVTRGLREVSAANRGRPAWAYIPFVVKEGVDASSPSEGFQLLPA
jgi:hypothetical protein